MTDLATNPLFTYIGNTPIGNETGSLPLSTLVPHYDAVIFAYGASRDRKLGIPGESLRGVHSARDFVGWYNGLPEHANLAPDLGSSDEAVVIGQGNVALDVARTLLSPLDRLRHTDMTETALEALSKSRVKRVRVVGRRGPLQAPFTIKEVRELMQLQGVAFGPLDRSILPADLKKLPRALSRISQLLVKGSTVAKEEAQKSWELVFMRSPTAFVEDSSRPGSLGSLTFDPMEFVQDATSTPPEDLSMSTLRAMRVKRVENTAQQTIDTKLAFRSVGYQSLPLTGLGDIGVPFDEKMGIIPNDIYGRVLTSERGPGELTAGHVPGMYCAGWVKRGPTGVIASTMDDAFTTADVVARDWSDGVKFLDDGDGGHGTAKAGWEEVRHEVAKRGMRSVSWGDWQVIDAEERRRGKERGKEREKCKSVAEMMEILDG